MTTCAFEKNASATKLGIISPDLLTSRADALIVSVKEDSLAPASAGSGKWGLFAHKKACRGSPPSGTIGQVKPLLKGRPCSGFRRKLLLKQCSPLRRFACKTRLVVRCQVPMYLVQADDGSSDEVGQSPRIMLARSTVHLSAAFVA